jgi:exosortase family protein XrtF
VQSNKTVIIFLIKFFGTYALLFLLYSFYLDKSQVDSDSFSCAPITKTVANQTQFVLNNFGYYTEIKQSKDELSMQVIINDKCVARVIEGCNAISIIILFVSFIVAFASTFKATFLYIIFGSLLIYFTNILRIAFIVVALYKYPQFENILHNIVFPSLIYGMTFLLWVLWVSKFSKLKK